jgi:two-component system, chemotaxis family, protein-glutamate methylesterase/glutaminase
MSVIPTNLDADAGDQPSELGCPACPGTLRVRVEGQQGYLEFTCRIGHRFSAHETFLAKEQRAEDRLWAALLTFEEVAALAHDLAIHASRYGWPEAAAYDQREASAMAQAAAVRRLVAHHRPIVLPSSATAADGLGRSDLDA